MTQTETLSKFTAVAKLNSMKDREEELKKGVEAGSKDPSITRLHDMIEIVCLLYKENNPGIVVEDENGEVRNITFAWYDKQREMLRMTIGGTRFEDEAE